MRKTATLLFFVCAILCGKTELFAEPGDFGRPRESIYVNDYYPWLWDEYYWLKKRPPEAVGPYTDDEQTLRNFAYAILLPPEAEGHPHWAFLGIDFTEMWRRWFAKPRPFDVQSYAQYLVTRHYWSATARYARITDDARADVERVKSFFSMANRVLEADAIRRRGAQFVGHLPPEVLAAAGARTVENRHLIDVVYVRFRERIASYRYALQCLVVLTPSEKAVEAERAIFVLEETLKRLTVPVGVAAGIVINK